MVFLFPKNRLRKFTKGIGALDSVVVVVISFVDGLVNFHYYYYEEDTSV